METLDIHLVRSSSDHTLTLSTPVAIGGEPGDPQNYETLYNKPSINGVTLVGDVTTQELGIVRMIPLTNAEIDEICI